MDAKKQLKISIDIRQSTMIPMPQFIQNDTNILQLQVTENGANADLSNITRIVVNYKRPDKRVISRLLNKVGSLVTYEIGYEEMQVAGYGELEIQFFESEKRISTKRFKLNMIESIGTDSIYENNNDLTLLQELFTEVETIKISTEEAEAARQANETTRQNQEAARQTNTTSAINRLDSAVTNLKLDYKAPVANFAAIATTYAAPQTGWIVQTADDGKFYRFNGATWEFTQQVTGTAITDLQNKLSDANRQSQTLKHGTQVINATMDTPVDIEVQGRTLTSLGNSQLEGGKLYVLADKRTKVKADGGWKSGVTKFQKSANPTTKANFLGKVWNSTSQNPHSFKLRNAPILSIPSEFSYDDQYGYDQVAFLDGNSTIEVATGNGNIPMHMSSFNVVEQIERTMGRIPKDTLADKVQWVKDNVQNLTIKWHGYGFGPAGFKASLALRLNGWATFRETTNSSTTELSGISDSDTVMLMVQPDGFVHYLAYAEPSDGVTASIIRTDYVELEVNIKPASLALLDTKPAIIRVANFEGKKKDSTLENPHTATYNQESSLQSPTAGTWRAMPEQQSYDEMSGLLDGNKFGNSSALNGYMPQTKFSFDVITEIERQIGRIPRPDVAGKIQWLRDNIAKITINWWGYGECPTGNLARIRVWSGDWNYWGDNVNLTFHAESIVTRRSHSVQNDELQTQVIQPDGFVHFLAYTNASDGVTASTIYTDYVELEIELKPTADFHDPLVPLYEVDSVDYAKILVDWSESEVINRYPKVQGTQHLQNVVVIAEGENLLPPFEEWARYNGTAAIERPYSVVFNSADGEGYYYIELKPNIKLLSGADYSLSFEQEIISGGNCCASILYYSADSNYLGEASTPIAPSGQYSLKFNAPANTEYVILRFARADTPREFSVRIANPMLTLGLTAKPFVPRNPSYLFATSKLGQVGDKRDMLYKQDGQWMVRKQIEKDVVLDGSRVINFWRDNIGSKSFIIPIVANNFAAPVDNRAVVTGYNGAMLKSVDDPEGLTSPDLFYIDINNVVVNSSDMITGFGESYTPTADEIKAYFNGWRMFDASGSGNPNIPYSRTDGLNKAWIPIMDVNVSGLRVVTSTSAPTTMVEGHTPYKLSYVMAPKAINVSEEVEGDITVNGPTQVEVTSGVVVREKVTPLVGNEYHIINDKDTISMLKYPTNNIFSIYRNGIKDMYWVKYRDLAWAYGGADAVIASADFDPTAEYTVTYLVLDRHLMTGNATDVKVSYDGSIKSVVDSVVERSADNTTTISVHAALLYDILKRLKAGGL